MAKWDKFAKWSREHLNTLQNNVMYHNGTEMPFKNEYWNNHEEGIYVDPITGEPLFNTRQQYDAGCGWPSFTKPINEDVINEKKDDSLGMVRTEVRTKDSDIHLGHVFPDGPKDAGGNRYCMNSAALRFVPLKEMEEKGYGDYIKYVKEN